MSVNVTKTSGFTAEITWTPEDDPTGYLAKAVESDQLAYALEALGGGDVAESEDQALLAAQHTTTLARLLERRAAVQVVRLRDSYGLSWRRIAGVVLDDPERQSAVRRMYDSGRRHIGI
ncbi:hypothetical protein ACFU5Z_31120 [Streptomyces sp. NPDC057521]|uniref:hypothetical protein n=1 Tax=Streptomyces sp. NPDC057521 TaxID=3346156 RepID=UPI0036760821